MKITMRYFGMLEEVTGRHSEELLLDGDTLMELRKQLLSRYEEMKQVSFELAVNRNISGDDHVLSGNEEIAALPPYSGG